MDCPTCGGKLATPPRLCHAVKPFTEHDVAPILCTLPAGHRDPEHWAPPLLPGWAPLQWLGPDD